MQMEQPISLNCESNTQHENIRVNECGCGGTPSNKKLDEQQPASAGAKKPTRQWAAWTRQEEEMFFNALRQFGKNFEKITGRVPSKNKDQVRHYYYRLLRRMNKLLGPEVCLDAKNSKDTNAAMLRWWSLLEKYSCKSSKLHLKPRRFKIFLETLANQLLKDRKKHKRKQPSQQENCFSTTPIVISHQGRVSVHDSPATRLVLVDSQNILQSNSGKEVSLKRYVNVGVNRKNCKPESYPASTVRQKNKPASSSKAAYKRWEKAAIAGVSLVADAAEHLERTTFDKEVDQVQGQVVSDPAGSDMPSCSTPSPNSFVDNNAQTSGKLKLQLFPIDEGTRKALEMDTHNPHLELTLSTRKKISSVLEHLNRKWGSSSVASGQLMLFPYYARSDNLADYLRWTQDSVLSAAEVYALIGSPSLFRLRYGWCSNTELTSATFQAPLVSSGMISHVNMIVNVANDHNKNQRQTPTPSSDCQSSHLIDCQDKDQQVLGEKPMDVAPSPAEVSNELAASIGIEANNTVPQTSVFWDRRETGNGVTLREGFSEDDTRLGNGHPFSTREWVDTLTNISIGDLLSDVPHNFGNSIDPLPVGHSQPPQGTFSCDSFDAAIAAHIYRHQNKSSSAPALSPFEASIWGAEETCDAFSFQKSAPCNEVPKTYLSASIDAHEKIGGTSLAGYGANIKDSLEMEVSTDEGPVLEEPMYECAVDNETDNYNAANENPMDQEKSDPTLENSQRNTNGLTNMCWESLEMEVPTDEEPVLEEPMYEYAMDGEIDNDNTANENPMNQWESDAALFWPECLEPFNVDIPSSKYHNENLILSDSLSGFSRMVGNSLDAFQNCSFFASDKKETQSGVEGQEAPSFSDYKTGNGVMDFAKA